MHKTTGAHLDSGLAMINCRYAFFDFDEHVLKVSQENWAKNYVADAKLPWDSP